MRSRAAGSIVPFVSNGPTVALRHSSLQSFPNGLWTAVSFDTELKDSFGVHSTLANTSRIQIPMTGTYFVATSVVWAASSSGERHLAVNASVSGAYRLYESRAPASAVNWTGSSIAGAIQLVGGEYIEVAVFQNSGSDLAFILSPAFFLTFV